MNQVRLKWKSILSAPVSTAIPSPPMYANTLKQPLATIGKPQIMTKHFEFGEDDYQSSQGTTCPNISFTKKEHNKLYFDRRCVM